VKSGLLLDVVVAESAAILELLAGEDETLLIRGDTLLVLDLGLHVVDGVRGLNIEGNSLTREGLDEDLHGETNYISAIVVSILQPISQLSVSQPMIHSTIKSKTKITLSVEFL